jgi:CheY-like chemotaxis protein
MHRESQEKNAKLPMNSYQNETSATIMIVDDNYLNRKILAIRLINEGYNVITAYAGMEAIRQAKLSKITIVLMDIQMPELDGFETTIILRKEISPYHQPVIIAYTSEASIEEKAFSVGMNDVVYKTDDSNFLMHKIKDWLSCIS